MKSGEFFIKPVMAGRFMLDGGAMFGVVPRVLWEKTNPADRNNRISMAMRSLYIDTGERKIIVDSGAGTKLSDKMVNIYQIESEDFSEVLSREGIDPESVTDVISTHLHFDHAGGLTFYDSDGNI
ncbi:MAG: MBL fold metallo-hydrolase, partial [Candidatus Latescibacteria bacterium]|nr:MBL fold metallo-hydrolase [bacterium]MBD3422942.1 MBL fold metallo-hydrolase [Candidatus Latescibacterota bacterium]